MLPGHARRGDSRPQTRYTIAKARFVSSRLAFDPVPFGFLTSNKGNETRIERVSTQYTLVSKPELKIKL